MWGNAYAILSHSSDFKSAGIHKSLAQTIITICSDYNHNMCMYMVCMIVGN